MKDKGTEKIMIMTEIDIEINSTETGIDSKEIGIDSRKIINKRKDNIDDRITNRNTEKRIFTISKDKSKGTDKDKRTDKEKGIIRKSTKKINPDQGHMKNKKGIQTGADRKTSNQSNLIAGRIIRPLH